jgi:tetratricopeptide (TPR) repeat protein
VSQLHQISGCDKAARKADVVFLHGLGGDPLATWRYGKDDSTSWPHWLGSEFPQVGVWSLGYAASPTRWARIPRLIGLGSRDSGYSMPLPDRALQVLDLMIQHGLGNRPLMFICHSLGGLLAKQILRKSSDSAEPHKQRVASRTVAVLFLATPHAGASLASLMNAFRAVFGATVSIEDLREHDAHLRDLFDWYRNHASHHKIQTVTYFEERGVKGLLPIVNPTSAHPGVGADPVGLDEDHLSIAKPRERGDQVCRAARNLLRDYVLAAPPAVPPPGPGASPSTPAAPAEVIVKLVTGSPAGNEPPRIPREMPAAASKFFGRETERNQLIERLRAGLNTAVVGPAGLGKTALAASALADVVGANAANLPGSPFPDGLVYLDLYTFRGHLEPAWSALANRLCGAAFLESRPARDRATEACRARRILVIVEGGEEADGIDGRGTIPDLFGVLSPENRWLLLTRLSTQSVVDESVYVREALPPNDAAALLDWLTRHRPLAADVRQAELGLLEGHPLALNWAGNLLAGDEEDPAALVADWKSEALPGLTDPKRTEHTLQWLFGRSVRGLDDASRQALAAAGLLARSPFPPGAIVAALGGADGDHAGEKRANEALKILARRGLLRRADNGHWEFTHVLGYRFARVEDGSNPDLRQRLGNWLHTNLTAALAASGGTVTSASPASLLQHAAALLRTDVDQRLWEPLAFGLLYQVSVRLEETGRLDLVTQALGAVEGWLTRFPKTKSEEPYWLRQHCTLIVDQGDVLGAQGGLSGALAAYRESLAVMRRLADADPSNALWQCDLSVSHNKVGDVLRAQGDLAEAQAAYRESLAVVRRLADADPSNPDWQRDLSVSQEKIGDVLLDQGDLAEAQAAYRESLGVRKRLADADPSNAVWQRDLSVSHNKVGDVLRAQGDLAEALAAYRESLAARRRLAEADPSNAVWQRDLSVSQEKIGDALRAQGDLAGALAAYRKSQSARRRLAEADPSNAVWQRDLSVSHHKVGNVLLDQGDSAGALAAHRESLAVSRRLAGADPSNAVWQSDLSRILTRMAQLDEKKGDRAAALPFAEESLTIDERLAALDPSNAKWQNDVAVSRVLVARLRG